MDYQLVSKWSESSDVKEAVLQWAASRLHGLSVESCGTALIERLEYLFFLHGTTHIQVDPAEDSWEGA